MKAIKRFFNTGKIISAKTDDYFVLDDSIPTQEVVIKKRFGTVKVNAILGHDFEIGASVVLGQDKKHVNSIVSKSDKYAVIGKEIFKIR